MRLALLFVVACSSSGAPDEKHSGSNAQREQAQFDQERRPELIVQAMGVKPGDRVADIGAGSGLLTLHLAKAIAPNGKVIATDTNKEVLGWLKTRMENAGLGNLVEGRAVDPDKPGLEAGQYDAILLSEVDHYFTDEVKWLKDAATALKPTGTIVISNRVYRRANAMDAAQKAGLVLKSETNPMPTHFVAVFVKK